MRCVDCKFHKAFPTTNIHWCEATKKHRRISDEDAYVDAPCKVADRKTEPSFTATDFGKGTITRYKDEPQTEKGVSYSDHTDYDEPRTYVTWTEPQTDCSWK